MVLKLCSAGAGTGKTHSICDEVIDAIVSRGIDPAMIVATTFTRKAASELKGRIEQRILETNQLPFSERIKRIERLELARIGTVHSIGQRFIDSYAFELGLSPEMEVLEEGSEARVLHGVMEHMDSEGWDGLLDAADSLGEESPEKLALRMLELTRANRISSEDLVEQLDAGGKRFTEVMSNGQSAVAMPSRAEILKIIDDALVAIADSGDATKKTEDTIEKLKPLRRRLDQGTTLRWSELAILATIKAAQKADPSLEGIRELGQNILRCSELHHDLSDYVQSLARQVNALDKAYSEYKHARGLLDFTDLEVRFLELLERDDLADSLKAEFSLVVVDEFQDTNPIQLAIFQRLHELAGHDYWVGDQKQAIYGFRGADARLVESVWQSKQDAEVQRLNINHRSQGGLVHFVNRLFANESVYGEPSQLEPKHDPEERGLERWRLQTKNKEQDGAAIAQGVAKLVEEGWDKSKICLLTRTNETARAYGAALSERGIDVALKLTGLLQARECAIGVAGLRIVADRNDSLAAAKLFHLLSDQDESTPTWLDERLRAVREQENDGQWRPPWPDSELLNSLSMIDARNASPSGVLDQVIKTLDLDRDCARFGEPQRRVTHLEALLEAARNYEANVHLEGGAPTISGLIAHLETDDGHERPAPSGLDAVTVSTVHSAKGLQWPVVILADLDKQFEPRLFDPIVVGGDVENGRPLDNRCLAYWPWPFGRALYGQLQCAQPLNGLALNTDEGIEAAERQAAEELRLLYVGMTRAEKRLVLAHRPSKYSWLKKVPTIDEVLTPDMEAGEHTLEDCQTTVIVRDLVPEEPAAFDNSDTCTWVKPPERAEAVPAFRDYSPSKQIAEDQMPELKQEALPGDHPFPNHIHTEEWILLGDAIHAYLAALPSLANLEREQCVEVATQCLEGLGPEPPITAEGMVIAGERLTKWITERFPEAEWATEIPVVAQRQGGGRWTGEIDVLIQLTDREVICIDHKAIPMGETGWTSVAKQHVGQLLAYQEALETLGYHVHGTWVHLPLGGGIVAIN